MLKTVSSVANALGALNYQGTWNATTNTPTLASGVGTQGDYYVVSVAGTTDLDGITNWGVGDWAAFNGSVWQRVEGGADGNFVNLDVTGTSNLAAIAGTGNVVLGNTVTNPASNFANQRGFGWNDSTKVLEISSNVAPLQLGRTSGGGDGQLLVFRQATNVAAEIRVEGNAGYFKPYNGGGIDFSATAGAGTSELFDDYEEGVFTPTLKVTGGDFSAITYDAITGGRYTKIGNAVHFQLSIRTDAITVGGVTGDLIISGLPYITIANSGSTRDGNSAATIGYTANFATNEPMNAVAVANTTAIALYDRAAINGNTTGMDQTDVGTGANANEVWMSGIYITA